MPSAQRFSLVTTPFSPADDSSRISVLLGFLLIEALTFYTPCFLYPTGFGVAESSAAKVSLFDIGVG